VNFLKICANSTSYGMFYELTPQKKVKPVKVKVFSGEHNHEQYVDTIEKAGTWYFPPIAALVTGGAHLLLTIFERCISDEGGHYLFCDTDSLCIVASKHGGWVRCAEGPRIKELSWKDVDQIVERFESLNCYDRTKVPGSILKIEKVNFDGSKQVELFGTVTSSKRYALYRYDSHGNIVTVDAKAHGLGYLYPPRVIARDDPGKDWWFEAWHWVLEGEVARPRPPLEWFDYPAMMQMTVSTPAILGMLKGFTRPFNFIHVPLLFPSLYPHGKDPSNFGLIMPFSKDRDQWLNTEAIDTHSGKQYSIALLDPKGRTKKVEVKCYGNVLGAYKEHPEAKFLSQDEKDWILAELAREEREKLASHSISAGQAVLNSRVWHLGSIGFTLNFGMYGMNFWMPQLVKSLSSGASNSLIGLLLMIPHLVGLPVMVMVSRSSDRKQERRYHAAIPAVTAGIALVSLGATHSIFPTIALLSVAALGIYSVYGPFYCLPGDFLSGFAAASGIALVSSVANLGGFAGPYAIGWISQKTGSLYGGLAVAGVSVFASSTLMLLLPRRLRGTSG